MGAAAEALGGRRRRRGRYCYTGHITFTERDTTEQYKSSERRDSLTPSHKSQRGGLFSRGIAAWVCFRLSPSTLWSISPGLYNIFKTVRRWYLSELYPSPCFLYFSGLNGKCVCSCQVQPSILRSWRDQMTLSNWRVFLASTDGSSLASVSGVKYSRWCRPQTGVVSFFHRYRKEDKVMEMMTFCDSVDRCFDLFSN